MQRLRSPSTATWKVCSVAVGGVVGGGAVVVGGTEVVVDGDGTVDVAEVCGVVVDDDGLDVKFHAFPILLVLTVLAGALRADTIHTPSRGAGVPLLAAPPTVSVLAAGIAGVPAAWMIRWALVPLIPNELTAAQRAVGRAHRAAGCACGRQRRRNAARPGLWLSSRR